MSGELFSPNPGAKYAAFYSRVRKDVLTRQEILRQPDERVRLVVRAVCIIPGPKHFRPKTVPTDL